MLGMLKDGKFNRRDVLKSGAAAAAIAAAAGSWMRSARAEEVLSVFGNVPPDPAPPGAAQFSMEAFAKWQADNGAKVQRHADCVHKQQACDAVLECK